MGVRVSRNESSIEEAACDKIEKELLITSLKLNVQGRTGWPDRIFFIPGGRPLLVEFKKPGEDPRPLQAHVIQGLNDLGYDVAVADNIDDALAAVCRALAAARLSASWRKVSPRARRSWVTS